MKSEEDSISEVAKAKLKNVKLIEQVEREEKENEKLRNEIASAKEEVENERYLMEKDKENIVDVKNKIDKFMKDKEIMMKELQHAKNENCILRKNTAELPKHKRREREKIRMEHRSRK